MHSLGRSRGALVRASTAVAVAALATVAALNLFFNSNSATPAPDQEIQQSCAGRMDRDASEDPEKITPAPESITISLDLDRTASVAKYLEESGLEPDEAQRWNGIFQRAALTRYLHKGHRFTLYRDPENGELRGFKYDVDARTSVALASLGNMVVKSSVIPIEYVERPVQMSFAVRDSFARTAARQGVPGPIVESLKDAFADRHDLDHLRPGSAVKLIYYEKISRDGNYHLTGDVEAAQISFGDRTLKAYAFRDEQGRAHLYDEQGRALGPQFLRFPLNFQYISSGFTFHRYHPILHEYRPHVGIDLVAQYGTPVKAVADGRVGAAGWGGELGKYVRIEHECEMTSIYGHLSRISPDVRLGKYVRMGQVIGWVGSTGLSTGPHLHYALEKQGNFINPLTQKLGVHHEVSPRMKAVFENIKQRYEGALAKLPDLSSHFVAADARKPAISPLGDLYHVTLKRLGGKGTHRRVRQRLSSRRAGSVIGAAEGMNAGDSGM